MVVALVISWAPAQPYTAGPQLSLVKYTLVVVVVVVLVLVILFLVVLAEDWMYFPQSWAFEEDRGWGQWVFSEQDGWIFWVHNAIGWTQWSFGEDG